MLCLSLLALPCRTGYAAFERVHEQSATRSRTAGKFIYQAALLMALHSSAHLWHSIAHFLHLSFSCFSHSLAQARQASAHCCAVSTCVLLMFLHSSAHLRQASAQAMQSFSHCSISGIPLHSEAQDLHSSAHLLHASMQLFIF